jgi:hypothetical protein
MINRSRIRFAAAVALLAMVVSSHAFAAKGAPCAVRVAGAQGLTGGPLGHVDAAGNCVATQQAKSGHAAQPRQETKTADDHDLQASAQCRDLSFSYSKRKDAACVKHGGVLEWLAQQ